MSKGDAAGPTRDDGTYAQAPKRKSARGAGAARHLRQRRPSRTATRSSKAASPIAYGASRLWGIDVPELAQTCPDGWPAGRMPATKLQALTAGRPIVCQEKDRDRYRIVAICRVSGEELGAVMVREGLALAFTRCSAE